MGWKAVNSTNCNKNQYECVQVAVLDRLILYFESFCMKTCQCTAHEDWFLRGNFDQHHTMYKNSVGWLSHMLE